MADGYDTSQDDAGQSHPWRRASDRLTPEDAGTIAKAASAATAAAAAMATSPTPQEPNLILIQYQLTQLTTITQNGFRSLELALDALSQRVSRLETWREREEAVSHAMAQQANGINQRWLPVFLLSVSVLATILAALIAAKII